MTSHEETRRTLLSTARALFAEQGVRKTTLDDIARGMHRTKTFLYHYFRNKDDLFGALIKAEGDEYMEELRTAIGEEIGARERMRAYVLARFRIFSRLGTYYRALREQYFEQYAFIENARRKYDRFEIRTVAGILEQGKRDGAFHVPDVELVAHALLLALKGFEVEWATEDRKGFERRIDALLSILFEGIVKRKRSA